MADSVCRFRRGHKILSLTPSLCVHNWDPSLHPYLLIPRYEWLNIVSGIRKAQQRVVVEES